MYLPVMTQSPRVSSKVSLRPQIEHVRQKFLECGICMNEYNDTDRRPRVLPCLHSFCDQCIKIMRTRDAIKCSECNESYDIPGGDMNNFRVDESREYLINYLKVQTKTSHILCEECAMKRKATNRCKECSQFLCGECTDAHKRTKITKTHNVASIEDLKEATLEEYQHAHTCKVHGHEDQLFAFYCYSKSCDKPVCALCAVKEHQESKGHEIRNIEDVYLENKRAIEVLVSEVKHRQLSADDTLTSIEEIVKKMDTLQASVTEEIDTVFDRCQKIVDRRRNELKNKLHTIIKAKKIRLQRQTEELSNHRSNMDDANEVAGSVSTYSTPSECLNMKDAIKRRLKELKEKPFDITPHDNADIKFQKSCLGDEFQEFLNGCGLVWSTSAYVSNSQVVINDVIIDEEDVAIVVRLFDVDGNQQNEGEVEVRVEVMDPEGNMTQPLVEDCAQSEGCYSVPFVGTKTGKHICHIYVMGEEVNTEGYSFYVLTGRGDSGATFNKDRIKSASTSTTDGGDRTYTPGVDLVLGDVICPEFVFDLSISHASIEISENAKHMKAKPIKRPHFGSHQSKESGRLINYRGTMANLPLYKTGLFYFEVAVQYKVLRLIRQTMLFEIALARLDVVDKHYSVDCYPYAWAVSARGCHLCGKVCLQTWHNGQLLAHNALSPRTPSPPGTSVRLRYGFLLDTVKRHWIVVDAKSNKVIFHFKNLVVSELSEPLWPLFGIYNPDLVSVTFQLLTGSDINSIPEAATDALVI
ncbi:E3 ubiquitin-protein ligase TRIM71-like [Saccostrea echinata]|uniref:E3 ubiquitin-protein ligase TRIM71-like n=1 Tax=Saccostrea echinata TaxID=191078 RepID=UPI002A81E2D3|nr:E3 ubiquitin-protein ligase TRIM71-like [Saccostrea echinata]